jgi:chitin disaccharide deacetylase
MQSMKLIVNGDDFGISKSVNEAIIRAFQDGVLTSCSLMVTGEAFDDAVMLARQNPKLAVGIHLVTVVGRSVLPHSAIPHLVDEDGNFSNNPNSAGLKYYFSPQCRKELRKELQAQFEKFRSTGIPLSHIDGHLHLHVHPVIFRQALRLGQMYGAKRMRVPEEELSLALGFNRKHVLRKMIYSGLFGLLAAYMKRSLKKNGFTTVHRVYGNLQSGEMSEDYFLYLLKRLKSDATEIYFHPAYFDNKKVLTPEQQQCANEFEALTSGRVKANISNSNIRLINYMELEQ